MVAPVVMSAWVKSSRNVSELESTMCSAPIARKMSACSGRRTMLTSGTPSSMQMRFSIWPRLEAAAVWTSEVWPSIRMFSTMLSAVSGLTKHEAPCAAVAPSGSSMHMNAVAARYSPYEAPPTKPTNLPNSACASGESPAATTVPAPSLPTGIGSPTRAVRAVKTAGGIGAVSTVESPLPVVVACETSAIPSSSARSDGLIGAASTRTSTSCAAGTGIGTVAMESSRRPSLVTSEWIWRIVVGRSVMVRAPVQGGFRELR